MKKIFKCSICLLLIVSLLSAFAVSSSALSSTTQRVTDGGVLPYKNFYYNYTLELAASNKAASATVSYGAIAGRVYARVEAQVYVNGVNEYNIGEDATSGEPAVAKTTNYVEKYNKAGAIRKAVGYYRINTNSNFQLEIE